ncbi:MAG: nucleotidyltransferase domain-containing protein [Methylotenera sp.]|nr:nucleotidyltransferase domain-containing protein [Oligoflexia bacterium]
MDPILEIAFRDLTEKYGCHTVILYGSRSRGDFTEKSDYDLMGIRSGGEAVRDARIIQSADGTGKYLDAFIYPENAFTGKEKDYLRIREGKVLVQRDSYADELLAKINQAFRQGPTPLTLSEDQERRVWLQKMVGRSSRGDLEGNYRRAWLQMALLEEYFAFRNHWYLGPKESFTWLAEHDRSTHALFEAALQPGASSTQLTALVQRVLTTTVSGPSKS